MEFRFSETREKLKKHGVLTMTSELELKRMYYYARALSHTAPHIEIVELGTHNGMAAMLIAQGIKDSLPHIYDRPFQSAHLTTIDCDPKQVEIANDNIDFFGYADLITVIHGEDLKLAKTFRDNSIHLLFVDTVHEYKHLMKLLTTYFPKVVSNGIFQLGGIICVHDYLPHTTDGLNVMKAIKEWSLKEANALLGSGLVEKLWWTVKE